MNAIDDARKEVDEDMMTALKNAMRQHKVLDLLEKYPGSYEALIAFADECAQEGLLDVMALNAFQFALGPIAPKIDEKGLLSFEFSSFNLVIRRHVWHAESKTWKPSL